MFILLLEIIGVNLKLLKEDLIVNVIDYVIFWIYILGVKGKYKIKLEEYFMYLLMRKIFVDMYVDFEND